MEIERECLCGKRLVWKSAIKLNDPPFFTIYCNYDCGEKNGWIDYDPKWGSPSLGEPFAPP